MLLWWSVKRHKLVRCRRYRGCYSTGGGKKMLQNIVRMIYPTVVRDESCWLGSIKFSTYCKTIGRYIFLEGEAERTSRLSPWCEFILFLLRCEIKIIFVSCLLVKKYHCPFRRLHEMKMGAEVSCDAGWTFYIRTAEKPQRAHTPIHCKHYSTLRCTRICTYPRFILLQLRHRFLCRVLYEMTRRGELQSLLLAAGSHKKNESGSLCKREGESQCLCSGVSPCLWSLCSTVYRCFFLPIRDSGVYVSSFGILVQFLQTNKIFIIDSCIFFFFILKFKYDAMDIYTYMGSPQGVFSSYQFKW